VNRERESRTGISSDASFFWVSLSNLVIDDNFRISNNLGLGLAANISTALPIQPERDREIEIILYYDFSKISGIVGFCGDFATCGVQM
jgi:hypothetical protein